MASKASPAASGPPFVLAPKLFRWSYDNIASEIRRRSWEQVQGVWSNGVVVPPKPIHNPVPLGEIPAVAEACSALRNAGSAKIEAPLQLARQAVFDHAVTWFSRSVNVLGSAEHQIAGGFRTWSISSAYQSSFFAARALLALLGIVVFDADDRSFLIDAFPQPGKANTDLAHLYLLEQRLEHRPLWTLLQRLLRITTDPAWPPQLVRLVVEIDHADFARHRNRVHYRVNGWTYEDCLAPLVAPAFDRLEIPKCLADGIDVDRPESVICVAYVLIMLSNIAWDQVAAKSAQVAEMFRGLNNRFNAVVHPLYGLDLSNRSALVAACS